MQALLYIDIVIGKRCSKRQLDKEGLDSDLFIAGSAAL
jgi:hypothetical protein